MKLVLETDQGKKLIITSFGGQTTLNLEDGQTEIVDLENDRFKIISLSED